MMDKIKDKFKEPSLATLFYIVAIIALVYASYTLLSAYDYIKTLIDTNQLVLSESWDQVINYIFENSFSYIFYGLVLIFCGYIIEVLMEKGFIEKKPKKAKIIEDNLQDDKEVIKETIDVEKEPTTLDEVIETPQVKNQEPEVVENSMPKHAKVDAEKEVIVDETVDQVKLKAKKEEKQFSFQEE